MVLMDKKAIALILAIIALAAVIIYLLYSFSKSTTSTTTQPPPIFTPSPTFIPSPTPTSSPPSSSSGSITVNQFLITNGCVSAYCWAQIQFTPSSSLVGATLTKVTVNYNNGTSYGFCGSIPIQSGTNTIWLNDYMPCNHLGCNAPTITSLTFVTSAGTFTVNVTPTPVSTLQVGSPYLTGGC